MIKLDILARRHFFRFLAGTTLSSRDQLCKQKSQCYQQKWPFGKTHNTSEFHRRNTRNKLLNRDGRERESYSVL